MKVTRFPGGVLLGLGLMYFLDPVRGRRRRARIREAVVHAETRERELLGKAARDAKQRAQGLVERATHRTSAGVPDALLESRVRAQLGHVASHPGAIQVIARDGQVTLLGPVFTHEAYPVVQAVRRVLGVRDVVDRMERHDTATSIPSLQGEGRVPRHSWSPSQQVAGTALGALLLGYGFSRRGLVAGLLGTGGGALLRRSLLNRPGPELVGRSGTVLVQKSLLVKRPIQEVFELWSQFERFPLFMEHVREVELVPGGPTSRWTVDGPAGTRVVFEAATTIKQPPTLIAWRTLANQPLEHEGRVRFESVNGNTRVHVHMEYQPPAGLLGHGLAHILGWDPKARMDDDLIRMKALLEEGKTRAHRQRVDRTDLH